MFYGCDLFIIYSFPPATVLAEIWHADRKLM